MQLEPARVACDNKKAWRGTPSGTVCHAYFVCTPQGQLPGMLPGPPLGPPRRDMVAFRGRAQYAQQLVARVVPPGKARV